MMERKHRMLGALTALLLISVLPTLTSPGDAQAEAIEERPGQCSREAENELWRNLDETPRHDSTGALLAPAFTDWFSDEAGQLGVRRLNEALAPYGPTLFGVAPKNSTQTMSIVVDQSESARQEDIEATVAALSLPFATEVVLSCFPKSELAPILESLRQGPPGFDYDKGTSTGLDTLLGRVVLVLSDPTAAEQRSITQGLEEQYQDRVYVVAGRLRLASGGRYNDSTPHFGAASLNFGHCTSNASLVGIFAVRFMPTAGHCQAPLGILDWNSGPYDYGDHSLLAADYPGTDIALMTAPPGHTYTNSIYTGPTSPTQRTVVGQRNATTNETVCMSGQISGARCNHWMVATDNSYSYWAPTLPGPTFNIDFSWTALTDLSCRLGDSGSPFYDRPGATTARVMGLLTAIQDIPDFGVRACFLHDAGIVTQYGNYLTSP